MKHNYKEETILYLYQKYIICSYLYNICATDHVILKNFNVDIPSNKTVPNAGSDRHGKSIIVMLLE